ncbi:MAG TPA: isocitrate lyase/phosphoenolpyruvate mutase family protein [Verrucomicrobiales bacterium]|nr:isocitrate lyase/phosphoenolpyruvate mutase family protein [Verrucomicrobiales bacterium]
MTTLTQTEKALRFRALHESGIFVMPNPWDCGSAQAMETQGFPALATSSFASALAAGHKDGGLSRDQALAHARSIVKACNLPVAADLESGFGATPEEVAETYRLAAEAGLAGASIEDYTGDPARPFYELPEAVDRLTAAVEATRSLPCPFLITARSENFLRGKPDLHDTIARLQAYEAAGADVLFAPGLPSLDAVKAVCSSVSKPVNFMAGLPDKSFPVADLAAAGVRRISLGTSLYKAAIAGVMNAVSEIKTAGTFAFTAALPSPPALLAFFGK